MKQDCQLKIMLYFLLPNLADQKNNDKKIALINKIISGGKYLKFMSYMAFEEFLTRLSLESRYIAQLQILLLLLTPIQI